MMSATAPARLPGSEMPAIPSLPLSVAAAVATSATVFGAVSPFLSKTSLRYASSVVDTKSGTQYCLPSYLPWVSTFGRYESAEKPEGLRLASPRKLSIGAR
jgi:hypothetical protein